MSNGGPSVQVEAVQSSEEQRFREIAELLSYRERHLTQRALESLEGPGLEAARPAMSPEEARAFVSDKAYEMIVRYETGGRRYYENYYKSAPVWPGFSSGVTIGFGYDLGYINEDEFVDTWGKLLPSQDIERLKEGIGVTGGSAQPIAKRLKDIRVTWEVSETVFQRNTIPKFVGMTRAALSNFDLERLHPHSTGALVSLVFNRGADFKSSSDKRREMRNIRSLMSKPVFVDIPDEFREMKRHWTSKGLQERRDEEADLFARGLEIVRDRAIARQPAPVPRPDPAVQPIPPVATPGTTPTAPAGDPMANLPMPQMPSQAPSIPGMPPVVAPAAATVAQGQPADATLGIPVPPEMGALESVYGTAPKARKVSLEDDWLEYDQQPIEKLEKPSSLESAGPSFSISQVRWAAEDSEIPDYRSVAGIVSSDGNFDLTAEDIATIIKANRYRPEVAEHGKILFGLRGCQLVGETSKQENRDSLKLRLARPDHRTFRCTIGVVDVKTRKLSAYIASTVPNRSYVYTCWQRSRDGEDLAGNMLPTGCYGYIVGAHNSTPGAFLLRRTLSEKRTVAVWRSTDDVTYTVQDEVDVCQPGDNIHPAYTASTADFSSAGCQTIRGNSSGGHNGEWADFRIAAGLPKDSNGKYGTPYSYVLMTGLEAKAAAEMRASKELSDEEKVRSKLVRLRQGSHGDEVKALQSALGLQSTGVMGAVEIEKLTEWQRDKLGFNDGIYSMEYDEHLGVNILGGLPPQAAAVQPPTDVTGQPAPVDRPDPVARPDAGATTASPRPDLGGGGQTAAGWALETVGGARGVTRPGAARPAAAATARRPSALENPASRGHVQALLTEDDAQLIRRLGMLTEQVRNDPRRAGQLELVTQKTPVQEGIFDSLAEVGERVYGRIEPELFRIICGSSSTDSGDRSEIQRALSSLASATGANKNEVVTAVAGVLMGSGVAFYGIALVVATIFVRRFAMATLEETCRVWGTRRRMAMGGPVRDYDSETS